MLARRLVVDGNEQISLADLQRAAKHYSSIQPHVRAKIEALRHPEIVTLQLPTQLMQQQQQQQHPSPPPPIRNVAVTVLFPAPAQHSLKRILFRVYSWLYVLLHFTPASRDNCSRNLHLFLYMLDIPKKLSPGSSRPLGESEVNTGFTFACQETNEIHIYRSNEWFKVFIHETFHAFGLDFAHHPTTDRRASELVIQLFPQIPLREVRVSETYAETWACIMHCVFVSLYGSSSASSASSRRSNHSHVSTPAPERSFDKFLRKMEHHVQIETVFILFQTVKIIHYNGGDARAFFAFEDREFEDYADDHDDVADRRAGTTLSVSSSSSSRGRARSPYRETSNIFAYYILRSILFFFMNSFLAWCGTRGDAHLLVFPVASSSSAAAGEPERFVDLFRAHRLPVFRRCIEFVENKFLGVVASSPASSPASNSRRRRRRSNRTKRAKRGATTSDSPAVARRRMMMFYEATGGTRRTGGTNPSRNNTDLLNTMNMTIS